MDMMLLLTWLILSFSLTVPTVFYTTGWAGPSGKLERPGRTESIRDWRAQHCRPRGGGGYRRWPRGLAKGLLVLMTLVGYDIATSCKSRPVLFTLYGQAFTLIRTLVSTKSLCKVSRLRSAGSGALSSFHQDSMNWVNRGASPAVSVGLKHSWPPALCHTYFSPLEGTTCFLMAVRGQQRMRRLSSMEAWFSDQVFLAVYVMFGSMDMKGMFRYYVADSKFFFLCKFLTGSPWIFPLWCVRLLKMTLYSKLSAVIKYVTVCCGSSSLKCLWLMTRLPWCSHKKKDQTRGCDLGCEAATVR